MNIALWKDRLRTNRFLRFCVIGGIGFLIDAGLMLLLHYSMNWPVSAARLVSFFVALSATWLLNRIITFREFRSIRRLPEWGRYALINGLGGLINLTAFFLVLEIINGMPMSPLLALVAGSAVALAFNYWGSKRFVFRELRSAN